MMSQHATGIQTKIDFVVRRADLYRCTISNHLRHVNPKTELRKQFVDEIQHNKTKVLKQCKLTDASLKVRPHQLA